MHADHFQGSQPIRSSPSAKNYQLENKFQECLACNPHLGAAGKKYAEPNKHRKKSYHNYLHSVAYNGDRNRIAE